MSRTGRVVGGAVAVMLLLSTLVTPGCVPAAWLADSSGFVFTRGTNFRNLEFCPVPLGETRTLAVVTAHTSWPAISPDGARIALARIAPDASGKGMTCELQYFSLGGASLGQLVDHTEALPWRPLQAVPAPAPADGVARNATEKRSLFDESKNGGVPCAAVFWDKGSGKIVIHEFSPMDEQMPEGRVGIYDPATKTLLTMDGNACPIGGTPVRPDGKGILITRGNSGLSNITISAVDWDGVVHAIPMPAEARTDAAIARVLAFPWLGNSQWDATGAVGTISSGQTRLTIDTSTLTGSLERVPDDQALTDGGKFILQSYSFPDNGPQFRVVKGDSPTMSMELLVPGSSLWKGLGPINDPVLLCPSPDRTWLLVRFMTDALEETSNPKLILINNKGEIKKVTSKAK